MAKKIFLSFRYSDLNLRNNLRDLFEGHGGDIEATPAYITEDVSDRGDTAVKDQIKALLQGCRGLLLLVGDTSHSSKWMDYEVQVAGSHSLPLAAVQHPQSRGGLSPKHAHIPLFKW